MLAQTTKTARFTEVVKQCGPPEPASLWTEPARDKHFMRAVRQNRVMTIKQEPTGTRKDFGIAGFLQEKGVSYLLFPKPLTAFQDRRIVGIKYDLVKIAGPVGRVVKPARNDESPQTMPSIGLKSSLATAEARPVALQPAPQPKRFKVVVRFTSIAEAAIELEADSQTEAREKALERVAVPDFSQGTITRTILNIQKI